MDDAVVNATLLICVNTKTHITAAKGKKGKTCGKMQEARLCQLLFKH